MKKIRIGILGCASIAERSVIPAIQSLPNLFDLIAVSSRTKEKASHFAEKFNCEAVVGYDELINRPDIEALYIPLPTGLHREYIAKALNKGKHVYAEKSIAKNYSDAKFLVNLAQDKELALMEGYMFQYHKQHRQFFEILDSGIIGDIRSFYASFGFPPLDDSNFRYDDEIGGGALLDCAGYTVRAAFFILKQDLKVKAASVFFNEQTNIYGNAYLAGENGVGAHIAFGFDNYYQCNYSIWGSKGFLSAKKAFTPRPDEAPVIMLETNCDKKEIIAEKDNHFIGSMKEFYQIIFSKEKNRHYHEIIQQSKALDEIKRLSLLEI